MNSEKIIFQNKEFDGRLLEFDFGIRLIYVLSLENILHNDGKYVSGEARVVDEQIFYYVSDLEIKKEDNYLIEEIMAEI